MRFVRAKVIGRMSYDFNRKKWWSEGTTDPHLSLFRSAHELDDFQDGRRTRNKENLARYLNKRYAGLRPGENASISDLIDDITLNVCKSATSTVASKICMHRPRPQFLTQNGSFEDQQRARGLQKFVQGVFSQNDVYQKVSPKAFLDCAIFDIGAVKVTPHYGKVKIERVLADELLVDEEAAYTAAPRELYQRKFVTKEVLAALYPKKKKAIMSAATAPDERNSTYTDLVEVLEAWHLKSSPKAKDGKRIIAIETDVLEIEDYTHDTFPFAFLRWDERPVGFYGQGLVEQLAPIQDEIDKTAMRIQESMHLMAVAWIIVDKASKIRKAIFKNVPGIIVEKQGGPDPKVQTNAAVDPQVFQYLDYLYNKSFELAGVSQLSATSRKPAGLESGIALRTILDTETQRFGLLARAWEQMHLDLARLVVRTAADMHEAGEDISCTYQDKEFMERISWKDVRLDEERFSMELYPTSMLPQTPAGKLAFVQEMMGLNIMQPEQAAMWLELPDTEKWLSLETATVRSAHQIAEFILSADDNWIDPEEFMDLQMCAKVAQKYWVRGHINKVPQKRLDNLARWINDALDLHGEITQATAVDPSLAPAGPGGPVPPSVPPGLPGPAGNVTPLDPQLAMAGGGLPPGV